MSFEKQVCWDSTKVRDVIHTDAETIPDSVFLAVHTDYDLRVSGSGMNASNMPAKKFLMDYFLDPHQENEVMTVVKGESGSGKSHLIQWMRLNIPRTEETHVITIPKSKTNLRSVLEMLIEQLPDHMKSDYAEKLHGTMGSLQTSQQKISKLLDNIAIAIQTSNTDNEIDEYLVEQLPNLFRDPYFSREYFNENHLIIKNLIEHIFGSAGVNSKAEVKQEFKQENLPLNAANARNAAGPTREVLDAISSAPEILEHSIELINANLDKAIAYTMSFSPDDLILLMLDIRRAFYRSQKKLILLIEDFALLQGVDTALLQALITRSTTEDPLCELRWAMAVTTGYFAQIVDTVQTRITFEVNMDVPWEGDIKKKESYIKYLGATYLNAVRQGHEEIDSWYVQYLNQDAETLPSKCDTCQWQQDCFVAFGSIDNVGLYPFNENALFAMARYADQEKQDIFRPREFINKVLVRNLNTQTSDAIKLGEYPLTSLLTEFPTNLMDGDNIAKLSRIDHRNGERRRVLLELWGRTGELGNLNEGIHLAFGLPPLENMEEITTTQGGEDEEAIQTVPNPTQKIDPKLDALNRWAQGAELRQSDADAFRQLIYYAIENYIEWDFLPVAKAMKFFERRNIYFLRQQTRRPTSGFVLPIPISENGFVLPIPISENESDIPQIQEVIKTLYLLEKDKHFKCELDVIARVQEHIQKMGDYVIKHLEEYFKPKTNWDPFCASLELLLLSSIASSAIKTEKTTNNNLMNAILDTTAVSKKLSMKHPIVEQIQKSRVIFLDTLKQTYTGRKGGTATTAFMDVKHILEIMKNLRKNGWKLTQNPEIEDRNQFVEIAKMYEKWKNEYPLLLKREIENRKEWLDQLNSRILIEDINAKKIKKSIEALRSKAQDLGLRGWQSAQLNDLLNMNFAKAQQAMINAKKLSDESIENIKLIDLYPSNRDEALQLLTLLDEYEKTLKNINTSLTNKRLELLSGDDSPAKIFEDLSSTINEIDDCLSEILEVHHAS